MAASDPCPFCRREVCDVDGYRVGDDGWRIAVADCLAATRARAERAEHERHALVAERDDPEGAAVVAFNDIAKTCGCERWEYPGQLVRDVRAVVAERDALPRAVGGS